MSPPMSNSSRGWGFFEPWRRHLIVLRTYWRIYGGGRAIVSSPYLHIAIGLTVIFAVMHGVDGAAAAGVGLFSSLLGFTIGALAIVLAVSSTEVFLYLAERGEPHS